MLLRTCAELLLVSQVMFIFPPRELVMSKFERLLLNYAVIFLATSKLVNSRRNFTSVAGYDLWSSSGWLDRGGWGRPSRRKVRRRQRGRFWTAKPRGRRYVVGARENGRHPHGQRCYARGSVVARSASSCTLRSAGGKVARSGMVVLPAGHRPAVCSGPFPFFF